MRRSATAAQPSASHRGEVPSSRGARPSAAALSSFASMQSLASHGSRVGAPRELLESSAAPARGAIEATPVAMSAIGSRAGKGVPVRDASSLDAVANLIVELGRLQSEVNLLQADRDRLTAEVKRGSEQHTEALRQVSQSSEALKTASFLAEHHKAEKLAAENAAKEREAALNAQLEKLTQEISHLTEVCDMTGCTRARVVDMSACRSARHFSHPRHSFSQVR